MKAFWRKFNGDFRNVEITVPEWMGEVYQGHAFTTCHQRYRDSDNFLSASHLALDFDSGDYRSSFSYLLRDPFIYCFAAFLYTTPSHTADNPKCRVCFALDRPIRNRDKYKLLAQSLLHRYGRPKKGDSEGEKAYRAADRSCRDVCRLFFGSEGCEVEYLGNTLSLEVAKTELVMPFMEWQQHRDEELKERVRTAVVMEPGNVSRETLQRHLDSLLHHVRTAPDGQKHFVLRDISRTVGGYVASGYYDESSAVAALEKAISDNPGQINDRQAAKETIIQSVAYGRSAPLKFEKRVGD
jgi:hypothetical protein